MRASIRLAAALAAAAAVLALLPALGPAGAQDTGSILRLASQTPWVGPGEELVLRLGVTTAEAPADVELAVSVYRRVRSRSEFTGTLGGPPRAAPIIRTPSTALSDLAVDAAGAVVVRLPVQDPAQPVDPARLRLTAEGVYPVLVELRDARGDETLASLLTHLVYTRPPQPGGFPLKAALVLPVHAPPALRPDGTRALSRPAAAGLSALARSLDAHPLVPLTLVPTPETLDALDASNRGADSETLAALTRAIVGHQIAPNTYVPVALSTFAAPELAGELATQLDRGSAVIERTLGRRPDSRTWVALDGLDDRGALGLRQLQVDRLVLPEAALAPVELPVTLAQPFEIDVRTVRRPQAVSGDPGLAAHLEPARDPVLAAHRLLADLAVVYQDSPSRSRGVVITPPRSWRPNKAFLDTLLAGLTTGTVVNGATLDEVFADVPPATTARDTALVRRLATPASGTAPAAEEVVDARRRLVGFASMLAPDNPLDDQIEELLLVAEGTGLRGSLRRAYLDGVDGRIAAETGAVQVPGHRSITLTARTGEIPVTVLRTTDYPLQVLIRVDSDKLDFPKGAVRSVDLSRRSTTETFSVRARTSGSFPLRVVLVSPDGALELGRSRFTVRSTAASGVGLVLSVGAGAFLLLWWGRHLVRGRRNRRLVPA